MLVWCYRAWRHSKSPTKLGERVTDRCMTPSLHAPPVHHATSQTASSFNPRLNALRRAKQPGLMRNRTGMDCVERELRPSSRVSGHCRHFHLDLPALPPAESSRDDAHAYSASEESNHLIWSQSEAQLLVKEIMALRVLRWGMVSYSSQRSITIIASENQ